MISCIYFLSNSFDVQNLICMHVGQEIFSSNSGQYQSNNEIATEDIKSLMTMPTAMKEYSEVIKHLYNEWQHVTNNEVDLGNILSYDGSVFKPQEIPYVHIVHCVRSITTISAVYIWVEKGAQGASAPQLQIRRG